MIEFINEYFFVIVGFFGVLLWERYYTKILVNLMKHVSILVIRMAVTGCTMILALFSAHWFTHNLLIFGILLSVIGSFAYVISTLMFPYVQNQPRSNY